MLKRSEVKILFIQLRRDIEMCEQEIRCICRSGNIKAEQITVINGLETGVAGKDLKGMHLLIIGGTGDFSIFGDIKCRKSLDVLLKKCRQNNFPVLGSCWGGQFIAHVFGGEVATDIEREEVGSYLAYPTKAAQDDPLFYDAPDKFWAQIGHHESILQLPAGAVNLIGSDRCEIQAFTWPGSNMYALQLHSDVNKKELIERIEHYRDSYAADPALFNAIIDNAKESPYTDDFVAKFINRIAIPRWN